MIKYGYNLEEIRLKPNKPKKEEMLARRTIENARFDLENEYTKILYSI